MRDVTATAFALGVPLDHRVDLGLPLHASHVILLCRRHRDVLNETRSAAPLGFNPGERPSKNNQAP
jgi:hypothetical protein